MITNKTISHRWALQWRSNNRLDGVTEYIMASPGRGFFRTYEEAYEYRKQHYGYIAVRKDLRDEPHGWRIIKVKVTIVKCR